MENQFLYQYLIPVLCGFTLLCIYIGIKEIKVSKKIDDKSGRILEDSYQHTELLHTINNNSNDIKRSIQKDILPKLNNIYKELPVAINEDMLKLITNSLKEIGITEYLQLEDEDGATKKIIFGIDNDTFKVTFDIVIDSLRKEIDFTTFSVAVINPDKDILLKLLQVNSNLIMGAIGIEDIGEKHIITSCVTIPFSNYEGDKIQLCIYRLFDVNEEVINILKIQKAKWIPVVAADYYQIQDKSELMKEEIKEREEVVIKDN